MEATAIEPTDAAVADPAEAAMADATPVAPVAPGQADADDQPASAQPQTAPGPAVAASAAQGRAKAPRHRPPPRAAPGRVPPWRILAGVASALVVVGIVGVVASKLLTPSGASACNPARPCAPPSPGPPLINGAVYGSQYGYTVEYGRGNWDVKGSNGSTLLLAPAGDVNPVTLLVQGFPATQSLSEDMQSRLSALSGAFLDGLTVDNSPEHAVRGAMIGYRPAIAGVYHGTLKSPQGTGIPESVVLLGSTDGRANIVVIAEFDLDQWGGWKQAGYFWAADDVLTGVHWANASAPAPPIIGAPKPPPPPKAPSFSATMRTCHGFNTNTGACIGVYSEGPRGWVLPAGTTSFSIVLSYKRATAGDILQYHSAGESPYTYRWRLLAHGVVAINVTRPIAGEFRISWKRNGHPLSFNRPTTVTVQ